jgi:penicillin-binding protein 2
MFKRKKKIYEIEPEEILLDSQNISNLDLSRFHGKLERPIDKRTFVFLSIFFAILLFMFILRLWNLQIVNGEEMLERSEDNRLNHEIIFPQRGVIYDRNGVELAWNENSTSTDFSLRRYSDEYSGSSHVLGYVKPPQKDSSGFYFQEKFIGLDGVEDMYSEKLDGELGLSLIETNALMEVQSHNVIQSPEDGEDIHLSIDARVSNQLYKSMEDLSQRVGFSGGASVMMDIETGEIIALSSFPEYSSQVMFDGDSEEIDRFNSDKRQPFLNRAISGLYTPGSIIKPYIAMAALNENIIDPKKNILSTSHISIPNPYNPELPTIFHDWKAHGLVDMVKALSVSSNIYFFSVGGGYGDQKGLGISKIEKYVKDFGIGNVAGIDLPGEVLGVVPNPSWKRENFEDGTWRLGDTYNTSIGQYGFQVTPIQMVRAVSAIANNGLLVTPTVLLEKPLETVSVGNLAEEDFNIIRQGMRQGVISGTAAGLNVPYVNFAIKTGTAELGFRKELVNSWVTGFFPHENPKYAFATVMEKGPVNNLIGSLFVMREVFDWMSLNTPEYFN